MIQADETGKLNIIPMRVPDNKCKILMVLKETEPQNIIFSKALRRLSSRRRKL